MSAFTDLETRSVEVLGYLPAWLDGVRSLIVLSESYVAGVKQGQARSSEDERYISKQWVMIGAFARLRDRPYGEACEELGQLFQRCSADKEADAPKLVEAFIAERFRIEPEATASETTVEPVCD